VDGWAKSREGFLQVRGEGIKGPQEVFLCVWRGLIDVFHRKPEIARTPGQ